MNPPFWTLYVEIWCSAALPVIYWCTRSLDFRMRMILFAALWSLIVIVPMPPAVPSVWTEWTRFLGFFYAGTLIAQFPDQRQSGLLTAACFALAMFLVRDAVLTFVVLVPTAFIIVWYVVARRSAPETSWLRQPAIRWVGRSSYSLYALHMSLLHLILGYFEPLVGIPFRNAYGIPYELLLSVTLLAVALPVSYVTYSLIEMPFNDLGRRLCRVRRDALAGQLERRAA
jgi:peptidoglycan/LPS O-acetylase OafA/YrhL